MYMYMYMYVYVYVYVYISGIPRDTESQRTPATIKSRWYCADLIRTLRVMCKYIRVYVCVCIPQIFLETQNLRGSQPPVNHDSVGDLKCAHVGRIRLVFVRVPLLRRSVQRGTLFCSVVQFCTANVFSIKCLMLMMFGQRLTQQ